MAHNALFKMYGIDHQSNSLKLSHSMHHSRNHVAQNFSNVRLEKKITKEFFLVCCMYPTFI